MEEVVGSIPTRSTKSPFSMLGRTSSSILLPLPFDANFLRLATDYALPRRQLSSSHTSSNTSSSDTSWRDNENEIPVATRGDADHHLCFRYREVRFQRILLCRVFPADVAHTQITPDVNSFVANGPGGAWVAQVKVTKNVAMPEKITKEFMEAKLAEVLKGGFMTQTGASSYTTFQGYPAVLATATFIINNRNTNSVSYSAVADMKLVFVKSQNRVYWVAGWAIQGGIALGSSRSLIRSN